MHPMAEGSLADREPRAFLASLGFRYLDRSRGLTRGDQHGAGGGGTGDPLTKVAAQSYIGKSDIRYRTPCGHDSFTFGVGKLFGGPSLRPRSRKVASILLPSEPALSVAEVGLEGGGEAEAGLLKAFDCSE